MLVRNPCKVQVKKMKITAKEAAEMSVKFSLEDSLVDSAYMEIRKEAALGGRRIMVDATDCVKATLEKDGFRVVVAPHRIGIYTVSW